MSTVNAYDVVSTALGMGNQFRLRGTRFDLEFTPEGKSRMDLDYGRRILPPCEVLIRDLENDEERTEHAQTVEISGGDVLGILLGCGDHKVYLEADVTEIIVLEVQE